MPTIYYWINVPAGQTVNVRSFAGYENSVLFTLPRGTRVIFVGSMDHWRHIRTEDGREGYVHYEYLSNIEIDPTPTEDDWGSRYGTTVWKKSLHSNTFYQAVKNIQSDLRSVGYTSVGTPDGYYGTNTETAVKNFQRNNECSVDGYCGNETKSVLWSKLH